MIEKEMNMEKKEKDKDKEEEEKEDLRALPNAAVLVLCPSPFGNFSTLSCLFIDFYVVGAMSPFAC